MGKLRNTTERATIPNTGNDTREKIKPYYVRRFKNDITEDAVRANFQDREIIRLETDLSSEELAFLRYQQTLKIQGLQALKNKRAKGD